MTDLEDGVAVRRTRFYCGFADKQPDIARCPLEKSTNKGGGMRTDECHELVGDEIGRSVAWDGGSSVSELAGKPVRLRVVMKDADLYSLRFH